jgi:hypothetical protein
VAAKTFSSLVNDQPTRQITLPNPDGVSHAAGTRGVICKNIFKDGATEYGFTPLANKGLMRTYSDANALDKWAIGFPTQNQININIGATSACRTASNGDLIMFAFIDPQIGAETSNTYLVAYALDATTGDFLDAEVVTTSSFQYDAGTAENEMEMRCWEPLADFFVCAFSTHSSGTKAWQCGATNYNTGTQTFSTNSQITGVNGFSTLLHTGCDMVLDNAADTMHFWFSLNNERGVWREVPIAGTAGAYTLGTAVAKLASTWNDGYEVGANPTPGCEQTRAFRLSNDDIICFGSQIAGTATNVDNTSGSTYAINILASDALSITQSYHLQGETPSSALTNKFYYHQVLFAFESATDEYVILTQCGTIRQTSTRGPEGWWPDHNGINHVRATRVVVNPADNTLTTNEDLGYFEEYLFEGKGQLKYATAQDAHERTCIMDYWHDSTNECVYLICGAYTTRLNFTTSYAATDNDNSDIVLSPYGPKRIGQDPHITATETYGTGTQLDDVHEWELHYQWRSKCFFDSTNKVMWLPCSLAYDNAAHSCQPGLLKWDSVQMTGTNVEVNVVTADATEIRGVCSVPVFANPGLPVGTIGGVLMDGQEYIAVSDEQLVSKVPTAHLQDLLILSRPLNDDSDNEAITFHPPGKVVHPIGGTNVPAVYQMKKEWLDGQFLIGDEHDQQYMNAFHSDGVDSAQVTAGYEGAVFSRKNVTTPLFFYLEGGGTTTHEGNIQVASEGWWVAGSYSYVPLERTGTVGRQISCVLGPSSKIEVNFYGVQNGAEFGYKFFRGGVDRAVY